MFVAEAYTGMSGAYVSIEENLNSMESILAGEYDDLPQDAFRMVATIEDAVEKAKGLG